MHFESGFMNSKNFLLLLEGGDKTTSKPVMWITMSVRH